MQRSMHTGLGLSVKAQKPFFRSRQNARHSSCSFAICCFSCCTNFAQSVLQLAIAFVTASSAIVAPAGFVSSQFFGPRFASPTHEAVAF